MITAYGTVECRRRDPRRRDNFVQKPWDNEKLLADIRAAVAPHRAEEESRSAQARAEAALQL